MPSPAALGAQMPPHSRAFPHLMKPPFSPRRANIALQQQTQACGPLGRSHDVGLDELRNLRPQRWGWFHQANERLSSFEAHFTEDSVQFHPDYAYGTAAALGNHILNESSISYWELKVPYIYGTSVMFGIGTLQTPVKLGNRFDNLLGLEDTSYGLSHKGVLYHNGKERSNYCEEFEENKMAVVGMYFNGPERRLSYFLNGKYLGVAFENINLDKPMYPMVSSTARKCTFILQNQYSNTDLSLRGICKRYVIHKLECHPHSLNDLGLPSALVDELKKDIDHKTLHSSLPRSTSTSPSRQRKRPFNDISDLTDEASAAMLMSFLSSFQYDQLVQVAWAAGMEERCDR
ncbi:unnamed protein product [Bursaphelenchus xylophilus]|uniref:(pine wood nematode) hypothetical protein n=1 Tax=Bursaphelenchus xylophilus TaxID=6326 RepID=A0A1I7S488_BURXY|nr:unnamed protein product [Bursaphelenchus xylophilus]CAG9116840.1 unnamed protein product [Bursaphelenchus xylophilus]